MRPSTHASDRSVNERAVVPILMAHMIAYFPSQELSLEIAKGLADGGAHYLEIQFPFSDPSADGSIIQNAGSMALDAGFTVSGGFQLVREIVTTTGLPVFIMSYANLVFRRGIEAFVQQSREAGATGLIVPDLAPGNDEDLYEAGRRHGIDVVPVVAPSVTEGRLCRVGEEHPRYLYAALRLGITGSYTEIGDENFRFLGRLNELGADVIAGFGISAPEQVRLLSPHVHALVVGSAFVKTILAAIESGETATIGETLASQVSQLLGRGLME